MSSLLSNLSSGPNAPHPVVEGFALALQDKEILGLIQGILSQHVKLEADEIKRLRDEAVNATNEAAKTKQELQQAQTRIRELEARGA